MKRIFLLALVTMCISACSAREFETSPSEVQDVYLTEASQAKESSSQEGISAGVGDLDQAKLVVEYSVDGESKDYDQVKDSLFKMIEAYQGYTTNVSESQLATRNFYASIKIPKARADEFVGKLSETEGLLIRSSTKSSSDVTPSYRDNELRIKSLEAKLDKLYKLQESQETVEDVLKVEIEIDNTLFELESYKASLKNLDMQIEYSLISFSMVEIGIGGETSLGPDFIDRVGDALSRSWERFVRTMQDLVVFFIYAFPFLIVLALIGLGVFFLLKKSSYKFKSGISRKKDDKSKNVD